METLQRVYDQFWSESYWLPPPTAWHDLKSSSHVRIAQSKDLYVVIPLTFVLVLLRVIFERFIAKPCLNLCGIKEVHEVEPNEILEKVYRNLTGQLEEKQLVKSLASKLGWTAKRVEQWLKNKRNYCRPSKMKKSQETCWRFVFYTGTSIWGVAVLTKEKFLYDTQHFWIGYPSHNLSDGIYYYYVVQLAFYSALLLSQFQDVKRKDFWIQIIHHVVTISLLVYSFICNFVRIGSVIMLVHDVADIILEAGKLFKYLKFQRVCDAVFVTFAIVFFVSRLIVFPFWIVRSIWVEYPRFLAPMPSYSMFVTLLLVLQVMHIFWFTIIARMAYRFLVKGEVENDARSESEESISDTGEEEEPVKNGLVNDKPKTQ